MKKKRAFVSSGFGVWSRKTPMIQTKIQFNLNNAKEYFREHLGAGDYYSEGLTISGEWLGQGAERLGLKGEVGEKEFLALCEGLHPETGERLGQRRNTVRHEGDEVTANRRIFFDFTISPPKSVSIVALHQDPRIIDLHERAVRHTLKELEKFSEGRVRISGQNTERITQNIVAACFRHDTSRELDPQLHTHCVVMNATFDQIENRWKALHPAGMYRAHRFGTNLYRHELAKGLRELGYQIDHSARGFEIRGVPKSLIERFSKRHAQIDEETKSRLAKGENVGNVKDLRERVAHGNRRRKIHTTDEHQLRTAWAREMKADELAALRVLQTVRHGVAEKADLKEIVAWADEHVFARSAVVRQHELLAAALERGRGKAFDLDELSDAVSGREYLHDQDSDKLTSREVLGYESTVVLAASEGRNRHSPFSRSPSLSPELSAEQAAAVEKILKSRDFITLFRGAAGTGKSFALREVEHGLRLCKIPVVVLAPQRQQVDDLLEAHSKVETLSKFLEQKTLEPGAAVIVDEAGQIGAKQLSELVSLVGSKEGRIILSGDTRQHGAVAASDALRAIEKHAGLRPAEIKTIRRQDPSRGETPVERAQIRAYRRAVKLAAAGQVTASFEAIDHLGWVRELAEEDRKESLALDYVGSVVRGESAIVVAQTREEVSRINEVIRTRLKAQGRLENGVCVEAFLPLDLDEAQKRDERFYEKEHHVYFMRGYGRFQRGQTYAIVEAGEKGLILEKNGVRSKMSYRYADRFTVVARQETEVAPGDRLQLKFNGRAQEGAKISNGELVTVREIHPDGSLKVEDVKGMKKTLTSSQRLFVRGYAVTSYASQGKTVDRVLLSDTGNRAATNSQQWYVSISRGRKQAIVYTADKQSLREFVQASGSRELAMDLKTQKKPSVDERLVERKRRLMRVRQSNRERIVAAERVAHIQQTTLRL